MAEKNIMISIDDEKADKIADILSNKTAKKILSYLAEKEASEGDIAKELKLPPNTVNYNIKKLIDSGLIESSKTWFWSVKGKKINQYKVSKKTIIISTKTSSAKVIGTLLITGVFALFIKIYSASKSTIVNNLDSVPTIAYEKSSEEGFAVASDMAIDSVSSTIIQNARVEVWPWFLLGAITALLFYMILNWRKL